MFPILPASLNKQLKKKIPISILLTCQWLNTEAGGVTAPERAFAVIINQVIWLARTNDIIVSE
jgi:hypothetical protein